jgi:glyoxylase-like metal-dependent hydrolase (beta-lactamase superfamily II)
MSSFSRRDALRSFGLLGLGAGLAPVASSAAAAPRHGRADHHLAPFYRTTIGDTQLTVVQDATFEFQPAAISGGAEEGAAEELLAANNLPTDVVPTPVDVLLIERGDRKILIDTGTGDYQAGPDGSGGGGQLIATLEGLGIGAGDIDTVVISHMHPDHVGAVSLDGQPAFPNAAYAMPEPEKAFLDDYSPSDNEGLDGAVAFAKQKLAPVETSGRLSTFSDGAEVAPGLTAISAIGHTPGHFAFLLSDGDEQLLLPMDAANHYVALFQHPEWLFSFDALPEETVAPRRRLLGRAADEGIRLWATHLPFPGFGYAVRAGAAFRFAPAP